MVYTTMTPKVELRDFGPFRRATITLSDLLLIIGKNASGKSMLLYLLWSLESIPPNFSVWIDYLKDHKDTIKNILECMKERCNPESYIRELIRVILKSLPKAWSSSLKENLPKVFGTRLRNIPRLGTKESNIIITGDYGSLRLTIGDDLINAEWGKLDESIIDTVNVKDFGRNYIELKLSKTDEIIESYIESEADLIKVIFTEVVPALLLLALGLVPGGKRQPLLVDGRAGIIRTIYSGYPGAALTLRDFLKEVLLTDVSFVELMYSLARDYVNNLIDVKAKPLSYLLRELGFEPIIKEEFGIARVYIKPRIGPLMPFEKAPSGIREVLPIVLSLLRKTGYESIYIEEPETHLHPRAIRLLARLIAYAINELDKGVVITTHSDYLLYQISNLIALSRLSEAEIKKLGYTTSEVLKPKQVKAYLLEPKDEYVEVKELSVTEEGVDEEAFEEVSRELFKERTDILG